MQMLIGANNYKLILLDTIAVCDDKMLDRCNMAKDIKEILELFE